MSEQRFNLSWVNGAGDTFSLDNLTASEAATNTSILISQGTLAITVVDATQVKLIALDNAAKAFGL